MTATKTPKFLRTLYTLLQLESPSTVSWSPCGTFFQIYDLTRLERDVLPRYFKHSKFASFQRQLNNFGFRKWTKTRASVCTFSHDTLTRCKPSELPAMLVGSSLAIASPAVISRKRHHGDDAPITEVNKKMKVDAISPDDERDSNTDVSDLLALDWCIFTEDQDEATASEDDDCVGLPIELFFPEEKTCETIDPLPLCESSHLDVHEWRLLAECLA